MERFRRVRPTHHLEPLNASRGLYGPPINYEKVGGAGVPARHFGPAARLPPSGAFSLRPCVLARDLSCLERKSAWPTTVRAGPDPALGRFLDRGFSLVVANTHK